MPRRLAALAAFAALAACDEPSPGSPPPIIFIPGDMQPAPDDALPPDAGPPPDMLPDGPPPDVGPACRNPCDDGDPGTTADRCIDDVCVGDPLPALLVLAGDGPQSPPASGAPTASALRVSLGADGVEVEPMPWTLPRGRPSDALDGMWLTRTPSALARTVVMQLGDGGFEEVVRTPAVPDARVLPTRGAAFVLVGDGVGPVVHVGDNGAITPLGVGLADAGAFIGREGDALVARTTDMLPGEPWVVDPALSAALDECQVLLGLGLIPRDGELLVVDVAGQRSAAAPITGPLRAGVDWTVQAAGSKLMRVEPWPPVVEETPIEWRDARPIAGGVLALDDGGGVWWIALDSAAADPVELGALPAGADVIADYPGGVVARSPDGLWFITRDEIVALPATEGAFAGNLGDRRLIFVGADGLAAVDIITGEVERIAGAFGTPAGLDGARGLVVRGANAEPLLLARLGADGVEPRATVWTPEPRTTHDDVEWLRLGGETAAFIAEADGPLVALDVADPAAEPIPVARLRNGERWSIGGVSADGAWAVWRAGDAVLGSLRGARTDGSHFPDGVELLRSRAYPVLMAPAAARLAVAFDPQPTGGFPVIDLDRPDPAEATWVVSEGLGLFPLAWIDGASLVVGLCTARNDAGECNWGLGRVDLLGGAPVIAPLVGTDPDILRPAWGRTVLAAGGYLYFVRSAGIARYQIRRIDLGGRGNLRTVAEGGVPTGLLGPADGGVVFEAGGVPAHVDGAGDVADLRLPGPLVGFGPLAFDRPLTVLAESSAVARPDSPCLDCRAWRLPRGEEPIPLGEGPLRPLAWSPAGDVLVHGHIVDGRVAPTLSDDTPGPTLDWPAAPDADIRLLRWLD